MSYVKTQKNPQIIGIRKTGPGRGILLNSPEKLFAEGRESAKDLSHAHGIDIILFVMIIFTVFHTNSPVSARGRRPPAKYN